MINDFHGTNVIQAILLILILTFSGHKPSYADNVETAAALNEQAITYYQAGQYAKAIPLLERALAIREEVLGPKHEETALSLNNLAALYFIQSYYAKAEPLYQRALAIREKILGPEHPDTANSLNNLAELYRAQGHYAKAEPLYQRALAIHEKVSGREHADTANSLNNLAELYRVQGHYAKAESLYQRALAIREKILGPEHVDTAMSLITLAVLYQTQGHYAKAEPLYQRALVIFEKIFGPEHLNTAGSLNNLAELYRIQGHYAKAEPLYQRALAILEKLFGLEHPDAAMSLNNLATLYFIQGYYAKAESLYQRALAIREKNLGPEHVDTAMSLNNLAELYKTQGYYAKAEPLLQRAWAIYEKILGPEHADTATSLNNLAVLYQVQGHYAKAEPLFQRTLTIREKILGPEHADTANSLNNLAVLYKTQGHYTKAEPLNQRALAIVEKMLGSSHPDTALLLLNYAQLHYAQDQVTPAIFYGKQAINALQASRESNQQLNEELRRSFLDSKESSYRTVADWLLEAGRLAEAEQVLAMLKEDEQFQYLRRNQASAKKLDTRAQCTTWEEKHCQRYQQLSTELRKAGKTLQDLAKDKSEQAEEKARLDELNQQLKVRNAAFNQGLTEINSALNALQADPEYKIHLEKDVLQRSNGFRRDLKELGNGAVTLHYLLLENSVKIILTTTDKQLTRSSDIKLTTLRRKVGLMRQAILRQQEHTNLMALSQELYQLLIAPVADELAAAQAKTLMVSLDGILRYLPFAALHDGEHFLTEHFALNLQTLAAKTVLKDKPKSNWRISGFGVSRAAEVMEPGTLRSIRFEALPFVQNELKAIIRQHPNDKGILPGEIFLDDAFSKQQLTKTLTQSGSSAVFHIGSHFELRPGDNSRSFLLLGQNAILTMADAFDENLDFSNADLVTLSACDTAMGADNASSNGAEIESFGVLVQELGAKSVLATLWPVIDESTSVFMESFYQLREQKKLTKAEALRQAQRSMINSGTNFAHPYYWAPFVLMGNWL